MYVSVYIPVSYLMPQHFTIVIYICYFFQTTKAFLPAMMERDHGHVVSIASSAGLVGVNGLADYCASKFAAVGKISILLYHWYV